MTRKQMIDELDKIREEIATDEHKELTDEARERAYLCVVSAIEYLTENDE